MERQSLNLDLDSLFPGESLTIGKTVIVIKPLGFEHIANLTIKLEGMGDALVEKGVTWDNYNEPANIFKIAVVTLKNFPDVLEEASNIKIEDLKKAPIEVIVDIVEKIISVNLKSKESLEKNFKNLAEKFLPKEAKTPPKNSQGKKKK